MISFRSNAAEAGDLKMVQIIDRALAGSARALREVARCAAAADAMLGT